MKERNLIIFKLVTSHILLVPGLVIVSMITPGENVLSVSITQTVLLILFFAGYWEFFGIKFKWIFCLSLELLILLTTGSKIVSVQQILLNPSVYTLFALIQVYLLYLLAKIIFVMVKNDKEKMGIEFPFMKGAYLVTDGGNSRISRLMNYHFHSPVHKIKKTNRSMLYATDIIKLPEGPSVFLPLHNEDYPIFNENVYSPMEGSVIKVVNDIADNNPYAGNYPYNTGNTVVIKNNTYYFLLGHLKKDSIIVREGDHVSTKDLLGKAGNSGMSERPHIHIQLINSHTDNYWNGTGVCLQFKKRNLYKNRIIHV